MKIIAKDSVNIVTRDKKVLSLPSNCRIGDVWEVPKDFIEDGTAYLIQIDGKSYLDEKATQFIYDDEERRYYSVKKHIKSIDILGNLNLSNLSIYLMHIKGFTASCTSLEKEKGTFLGAIKKLDYIKDMGFNAIELMPVYRFVKKLDNGKINYWGYSKGYYYSLNTDYAVENEIDEFIEFVKACHSKNIAVIMQIYFPKEIEYLEVINILKFWKVSYGIDGFNVSGSISNINEVINSPYFSDTLIYTDWNSNSYSSSDDFMKKVRAFVRGDDDACKNFIKYIQSEEKRINYASYYNGFTLNDVVSYERKHNEKNGENNLDGEIYNYSMNFGVEGYTRSKKVIELRDRAMENLLFLTFLSRGIPRLYMGDEIYRTQYGNNNTYYIDEDMNYLKFDREKTHINFIKKLNYASRLLRNNSSNKVDYLPSISIHQEDAWNSRFEPTDKHFAVYFRGFKDYLMVVNMSGEKRKIGLANELGKKYTYIVGNVKKGLHIVKRHLYVEPFSVALYEIGE